MDRLTASSNTTTTTMPLDWPLSSTPHPSLINVPKESKRHCRLLPAGMVDLTLAQMTEAIRSEEMMMMKREKKGRREAEMFVDFDDVRSRKDVRMERERERKRESRSFVVQERKSIDVVEPATLDEILDSVDELFSTLDDSPVETNEVGTMSLDKYSLPPPPPPKSEIVEPAEPVAEKTNITNSSSSSIAAPSSAPVSLPPQPTTTTTTTLPAPIDFLTALHSNPPTSFEIANARNLSAKHERVLSKSTSIRKNQSKNVRASFDAMNQYGRVIGQQQQRGKLMRYMSAARRTKTSVSKAVWRGFDQIFR